MGLSSALATAMSGLRANQASLSIISSNVANAQTPGGDGTLETALNNFTASLQSLSSNPGNQSAQSVALSAGQTLAQQLNATTRGIQSLRTNVEQDIGNAAGQANTAMNQIAQINT